VVKKKVSKISVKGSKNSFNRNALVLIVVVVFILFFAFYRGGGVTGNAVDGDESFDELNTGFFGEIGKVIGKVFSEFFASFTDEEVVMSGNDGDCSSDQYCIANGLGDECLAGFCTFIASDDNCGVNGCGDDENQDGDGSCSSPDDCHDGDICSYGYCFTPDCSNDIECVTDFGPGYVCNSQLGYCTDCEYDTECATGEYCYYGGCLPLESYGGSCEENSNCISDRCSCSFNTLPELCPESDPPSCKCNTASDCVDPFDSTDEASDWTCHTNYGICKRKLEIGEACTSHPQCKSDACVDNLCVECRLDSQCPSEMNPDYNYCKSNTCRECKTDNNCIGNPNGVMCSFGSCTPCSDFLCTFRENIGNPGVLDPHYCLSDDSNVCVECRDNFDCKNTVIFKGDICSNINYCEPCENNAECGFGFTCNNDAPRKCVVEILV